MAPEGRVFTDEQTIARPREEVFRFFSRPQNLEAITPPWLKFRMVEPSSRTVEEGAEFTYRLKIRGIPITWKSRISEWKPGESFVDVQLKGPYALWHHTHSFEDCEEGTRIRDRVVYRLPLGWLVNALAGPLVESDIRKIFAFRKQKTEELLISGTLREG